MEMQRLKMMKKDGRTEEATTPRLVNQKVKPTGILGIVCDQKLLGPTYIKDLDKNLEAQGIVADLFEQDSKRFPQKPIRRNL